MIYDGVKYPINICEAKQQGTNDKRKDGKKPQSLGNAIERSCKNYLELYFTPFDYFPYNMFLSGCDFKKKSYIIDRLDVLTNITKETKIILFILIQSHLFG